MAKILKKNQKKLTARQNGYMANVALDKSNMGKGYKRPGSMNTKSR